MMPSRPCQHPTCANYVPAGRYCPLHADSAAAAQDRGRRRRRGRWYDQHARDPEAKAFYNSAAWKRARSAFIAKHPVCQRCNRAWAKHVHHRVALADCTPAERLDPQLFMSVCVPCHNAVEAELKEANRVRQDAPNPGDA